MLYGHDEGKNIKLLCDGENDTVCVEMGGTGADTAAGARTNLGAAAASHTHPGSDITTPIEIAGGGTGANTVAGAIGNLFEALTTSKSFSVASDAGIDIVVPYPTGKTVNDVVAIKGFFAGYSGFSISDMNPQNAGISAKVRNLTSATRSGTMTVTLLYQK